LSYLFSPELLGNPDPLPEADLYQILIIRRVTDDRDHGPRQPGSISLEKADLAPLWAGFFMEKNFQRF